MEWDDFLEAEAAELQQKGGSWRPLQIASSAGFLIYFAWTGALALGFRKVSLQVPYVPSSAKQVQNMMSLLKGHSGKLVDLGSGDGRIADLSDCSNVTVFLAPSVVPQLEKKLLSELPDEACVVAARFPFFQWTPSKVVGESLEKAWAYSIRDVRQAKAEASGRSSAEEATFAPNMRSCNEDGREETQESCFPSNLV
ncbi:protein FAM173A-like isoform X3 [Python bivittatus]|uniref:Protein FAM173A-like isoform X3 n=1 Tax=Python bivittatus TaxID=176946 RepID=A0A9F5IMK6_PYTBI|nr:protein FAM173A-like isoform X3 [Python bivittatus]